MPIARQAPPHATNMEASSKYVRRIEKGSLYPALHRLEESAWIKAKRVTTPDKRRARKYEITGIGRKQREEEARWKSSLPPLAGCFASPETVDVRWLCLGVPG